jgi:uncharacterized protein YbjT (DUF2867 family)
MRRMRILVLGASGGCGNWATRLAAADGHAVTALVRPEARLAPPAGVTVLRGSVLDAAILARAVDGQDAVISCLGAQRVNPRLPWSPLRPPGPIAERSATALVSALSGTRIRRVAAISAAGVGDSLPATNALMRWLLRTSTIGEMYADLERMEAVYRASDLDWIAVRPVTLIEVKPSSRARVVTRFRMSSVIAKADVAAWLLRSVTSPEPLGDRTPMIAWR